MGVRTDDYVDPDEHTRYVYVALAELASEYDHMHKNWFVFRDWDNPRRVRWIQYLHRNPHLPVARLVLARASLLRIKG